MDAGLWLRTSTDNHVQDPKLQRANLDNVCHQRGWNIVKVFEVEESAFGQKPREQFQAMLEDERKGKFQVLVVWSMDHFSCEGFRQRLDEVLKQLNAGQIFHRKAAKELKIGYATLKRPWTGTKGKDSYATGTKFTEQ